MRDDETGEALMQRADDIEEALKKRLKQYHDQTMQILAQYGAAGSCKLCYADANRSANAKCIDEVWAEIVGALKVRLASSLAEFQVLDWRAASRSNSSKNQ